MKKWLTRMISISLLSMFLLGSLNVGYAQNQDFVASSTNKTYQQSLLQSNEISLITSSDF
ncbi:hypothetical protein [Facilibium subflavum]|uniref:hypothetical protein n=1 Tax=Facilibium subflavum TaxID=2219058 RepID=UPI000E64D714|nr:hypothetical protein [Facilibium subflavum]